MIRVVATGRIKDKRLARLQDDYLRRVRNMAPAEVVEVRDSSPEKEAAALVQRVGSPTGNCRVFALDEHGESISSHGLSRLLGQHGNLAFLIGGADGLGAAARERADRVLRLSSLTLTHEMARVLLLEQIYRGLCILRNRPYHRG